MWQLFLFGFYSWMEFHRKTIRKPIEKVAVVNYPTVHKSLK
jgi:hypothetical protein